MRRLWLIFSQAATVGMALLFVVATLKPQWLSGSGQPFGAVVAEVVSLRTAAPARCRTMGPEMPTGRSLVLLSLGRFCSSDGAGIDSRWSALQGLNP